MPGTEQAASFQALKRVALTWTFAKLAGAGLLFATVAVTLAVSVVPLLGDYGLQRGDAAGIAALLGLAAITGRLTVGVLLDRIPARYIAAACTCLPVAGVSLLLGTQGSLVAASAAVLIFGLSLGAELDILAYLTSRYFPIANFGFLFGIMGGLVGVAGGVGPVLLSLAYDSEGTYDTGLWATYPLCLCALVLFLWLGPTQHVE